MNGAGEIRATAQRVRWTENVRHLECDSSDTALFFREVACALCAYLAPVPNSSAETESQSWTEWDFNELSVVVSFGISSRLWIPAIPTGDPHGSN